MSEEHVILPIGMSSHMVNMSVCQAGTCGVQPAAMDVDGGQPVPASKLQLVETLSAEVNASTARDTNGKAHTAPEHKVTQGATELPVQVRSWSHAGTRGIPFQQR